jgi:hypothetical protein
LRRWCTRLRGTQNIISFVLDIRCLRRNLACKATKVVVKILLVIDRIDDFAKAPSIGGLLAVLHWANVQAIAQQKLLVERCELLHLKSQSRITFLDQILHSLDCLRPCLRPQLGSLSLRSLHFSSIIRICGLDLSQKILFMLRSRFGSLDAKLLATLTVSSPGAVIILSQRVVLGL